MPVHHRRIESGHTYVFGQQIIRDPPPPNTPLGPEFPARAGGTEGIALATKQDSALCLCITGRLNPHIGFQPTDHPRPPFPRAARRFPPLQAVLRAFPCLAHAAA